MFTEKITFLAGILVGNQAFTEALLEEETFSHTLRSTRQPGLDLSRLDDDAYFDAALLATRLTVPGLFEARMKHDPAFRDLVEEYAEAREMKVREVTAAQVNPVSAEIIEGLSRSDGRLLIGASNILAKRRSEFREEALAAKDGHPGADEAGVHGGEDPGQEPG